MKILNELNTTYGVKVCAIIMYRPNSQGVETEEEMLEKKIEEAKEKLKKQREENRVKELTIKLHEIMKAGKVPKDLGVDELKEIDYAISLKLKEIDGKLIEAKKAKEFQSNTTVEGTEK